MYECTRCGYTCDKLCNLKKHLNRKTECEPKYSSESTPCLLAKLNSNDQKSKMYKCDECGKEYSSRSGLFVHKKKNACKITDIHKLTETVEHLLQKNKDLESKIAALAHNQQPQINNSGVINNIQINMNNFGEENLQHLSCEFLNDCMKRLNTGMKNLVKHIHFNPNIPENHNIRVLSKKQNLLETFKDGNWHPCDKNNTLDEMIKKGYRILFQHFINNPDDTSKELTEQINDYFRNLMNKDHNIYYNLRRELYVMIMDNTLYILTN
jgi:hypothetical protein